MICAEQLALGLGGEDAAAPTAANDDTAPGTAGSKRTKARRNIGALPAHLPRHEQVIEPSSTLCPCCMAQMRRIGEDVAEALDRVPALLRVLRTIRPNTLAEFARKRSSRRKHRLGSSRAAW
ncbi:hypothetical protein EOA32_35325 [Mesorhizobium sp. M1A.F.Ca.ET.072.01.1.1]|uniref:IS66 family transposase zinc-finger binding domain-containing protein n=1 Tax=Mesorhizobium sp. M1A.F.Ca.ET.072.01.1.1 TaxID=2496753 RepID=UPI000FD1F43F|nr:hypothetical protein EOA32_35325 [Mesorhizobium sp. M1A.F.Ca.ET.072.01.1.1]